MTDEKVIINTIYHAALVTGIAAGYVRLTKMMFKTATPKLDYMGYDLSMSVINIGAAMYTKDVLVKQGIIPADIIKQLGSSRE